MKIRYLTTKFRGQDGETWLNKNDMLKLLNDDSVSKLKILEELSECYYKEVKNDKSSE